MILIDYSPVIIASAHSATKWKNGNGAYDYDTVAEAHLFRMWHTLRNINVKFKRKYGEIVFCVDRKPYWRNDVFPNYKKNRKAMDKTLDWKTFFATGENILDAARNIFGWKVIDIPGLEADDIIGTLAEKYHNIEKIMIVSPDGDFKQLQMYKNVEQFDTIRDKKIIENYPNVWLKEKIITGDKKDCIPNILSDVNTFVMNGVRQKTIQHTTKQKWVIADPALYCDAKMFERYQLNESLIDLSKVPNDLKDAIIQTYQTTTTNRGKIYSYFASNGLSYFIDVIGDFS